MKVLDSQRNHEIQVSDGKILGQPELQGENRSDGHGVAETIGAQLTPSVGTLAKSTSRKKIEANRRNALKSTGPKTPRGKANIRFNALRHGFCSKQVVLVMKVMKENLTEFEELCREIWKHFQPQGRMEELDVDTILVCLWMDRRLVRRMLYEERVRPNMCSITGSELHNYLAEQPMVREMLITEQIKELEMRNWKLWRKDACRRTNGGASEKK